MYCEIIKYRKLYYIIVMKKLNIEKKGKEEEKNEGKEEKDNHTH